MQRRLRYRARDWVKDRLYAGVSGAAYRFAPRAWLEGFELWYHLRNLFGRLRIAAVLDVGANRGQFRNFLRRRCGFRGWIFSFEPIPAVFAELQARAADDPRWRVFPWALGSQTGTRALNVMRDSSFSSFLEPLAEGGQIPVIGDKNVVLRREAVPVRRLAEVLPGLRQEYSLGPIYLKLDTQGFDLEVLRGAEGELQQMAALQTEVPVKALYQGMPGFAASLDVLAQSGFEVTGVFPVTRDERLRVIEFDVVAVNARRTTQFLS